MKLAGLIVILLGWFVAVSSTQVSSSGAQIVVALLGFVIALGGIIGILNPAHNKNAVWKS